MPIFRRKAGIDREQVFLFTLNGDASHSSKRAMAYQVGYFLKHKLISCKADFVQLIKNPDFNPCDYSLWRFRKAWDVTPSACRPAIY